MNSNENNGIWEHFQKIENPSKNKGDNFGASVSLDEDTCSWCNISR